VPSDSPARNVDAGTPVAAPLPLAPAAPAAPNPLPVTATDPTWGSAHAPVTIIVFSDFQCPFCSRGATTLEQLRKKHGPDAIRIVWKNLPLPFHDRAKPAAEAAMAVFDAAGSEAFWAFHDKVFANQRALSDDDLVKAAGEVGVRDLVAFRRDLVSKRFAPRVEADLRFASEVGVGGTPHFFINGIALSGAQPLAAFEEVLTKAGAQAEQQRREGASPENLYASLVRANYAPPRSRGADEEDDDAFDKTVHAVPVGTSPVRGAMDAAVTLVVFSDFQCPFCKRGAATVAALEKRYGSSLRVVFKHEPLSFHPRAEPAAEFAEEARAQKGNAGFWAAHDKLFELQPKLENADLEEAAKALGLDVAAMKDAIATKKHAARIDADADLAEDVEASGTPHFFVNGRRLVGAQPEAVFAKVVDEELAQVKARVAKGTKPSDVYVEILKDAKPAKALETKVVPAPTGTEPFRGDAHAKVVITQFSDFQCPFCARVEPTVDELLKSYGGRVKLVWRNLPLPMHPDAPLAAEAALEAFAQQGNAGFWAMHKKLFSTRELSIEVLHGFAQELKLDVNAFDAALRDHRHKATVDRDSAMANAAGIGGTPAFVINGRFIAGAQPLKKFRRAVEQALADVKK
jgi:protein-disulfide isomerase